MVVGNTHLQYREIFERDSATETILVLTRVRMKGEKCVEVLIGSAYALYQCYYTSSVARQIDGKPYQKKEQRVFATLRRASPVH